MAISIVGLNLSLFIGGCFSAGATLAAFTAASAIGAADTFLTLLFGSVYIIDSRTYDCYYYRYYYCIDRLHKIAPFIFIISYYAASLYSFFIFLFVLWIIYATAATITAVTAQPTIGIHAGPILPPVMRLPKKNTAKLRTYPTAN